MTSPEISPVWTHAACGQRGQSVTLMSSEEAVCLYLQITIENNGSVTGQCFGNINSTVFTEQGIRNRGMIGMHHTHTLIWGDNFKGFSTI